MKDAADPDLERFDSFLDHAMRIAEGYGNTPGAIHSELRQEARLALADAARAFKPSRDSNFSSFARTVINNRLKDVYRKEVRHRSHVPVSLDEPVSGESQQTRGEMLFDERSRSPLKEVTLTEAREVLNRVISELSERERKVVRAYLNFEIGPETAKELGITKQAISQIRQTAFSRLRRKLTESGIPDSTALSARPAVARGKAHEVPRKAETLDERLDELKISDLLEEIIPDHLDAGLEGGMAARLG